MTDLWYLIIVDPMLNGLISISALLPKQVQFGLAIILLTIIVRLVLLPVSLRQLKSTKAMQSLQPKMQEIQKKYSKNKQKLQQETMKLYRESGVNPVGCMGPMLIQFPVWIALYQSIMKALATTPENLLDLSHRLYSWQIVSQALPLNNHFLWLDLSSTGDFFLAILVGGSMWVQQKMTTPPSADPKQQSTSQSMQIMMPFMFGAFVLMFPSGLAIYWLASNFIGIATQYFLGDGWGYLTNPFSTRPKSKGKRA
jgi:YidC/Oxa1 family membrane protein insertase